MSGANLMPVTILEWRPMKRNSLLGFVTIQLGALKIKDVTINENTGRHWAGMPAKVMVDREGATLKTPEGKLRYAPILEWANKAAGDRFSESVIAALEAAHPGATTE